MNMATPAQVSLEIKWHGGQISDADRMGVPGLSMKDAVVPTFMEKGEGA